MYYYLNCLIFTNNQLLHLFVLQVADQVQY